jgi:hypothetical protein
VIKLSGQDIFNAVQQKTQKNTFSSLNEEERYGTRNSKENNGQLNLRKHQEKNLMMAFLLCFVHNGNNRCKYSFLSSISVSFVLIAFRKVW